MTQEQIFSLDLSVLVNSKIGTLRDDTLQYIDTAENWLNSILNQSLAESRVKKKKCEICNSESICELHHVAARKHDFRTITVCKPCHAELSESQKTWDARWYKLNQPQALKYAFFLLGLHDILLLKSKKTANSIYEELAKKLRQEISTLLKLDDPTVLIAK